MTPDIRRREALWLAENADEALWLHEQPGDDYATEATKERAREAIHALELAGLNTVELTAELIDILEGVDDVERVQTGLALLGVPE